jgi:DNA modification methylase
MTGRAIVLRGDAARLPLPDASADLIVCSPPYFGLRSYTDGGEHYHGQIGSEPTPAAYLDALWGCTAEWVRVLKPSGSLFVNLGDKYASGGRTSYDRTDINGQRGNITRPLDGAREKSLLGLPWKYALGCIDQLGLILRAEIIWNKPNGLPESVTDRVRRSHEQVFHFTRQPRYYSAVDEVRLPAVRTDIRKPAAAYLAGVAPGSNGHTGLGDRANHALGSLPGSVWSIPSAPLTVPEHLGVDHFAAYPPELVRRIILGWSPREVCTACGEGRRPVSDRWKIVTQHAITPSHKSSDNGRSRDFDWDRKASLATITGYACACHDTTAPATPGLVLDPFGGTGTTALVAAVHGRTGITIDRSADYSRLAAWRVSDPAERARALGVPKPPPVTHGQEALFSALEVTG